MTQASPKHAHRLNGAPMPADRTGAATGAVDTAFRSDGCAGGFAGRESMVVTTTSSA